MLRVKFVCCLSKAALCAIQGLARARSTYFQESCLESPVPSPNLTVVCPLCMCAICACMLGGLPGLFPGPLRQRAQQQTVPIWRGCARAEWRKEPPRGKCVACVSCGTVWKQKHAHTLLMRGGLISFISLASAF